MVAKSSTNPVFLSARTGAEAAAKDLSQKYGISVVIDWRTPPRKTVRSRRNASRRPSTTAWMPCLFPVRTQNKLTGVINDAVARGVPVMTFDSDAPASKAVCVLWRGQHGHRRAGDVRTGEAIGRQRQSSPSRRQPERAQTCRNASRAWKKEAAKYPDIEIVGTFYHAETPQDGRRKSCAP